MDAQAEREHIASKDCWCKPRLEHTVENGAQVWIHNDPEGTQPPIDVIAEAIARAADDQATRAS